MYVNLKKTVTVCFLLLCFSIKSSAPCWQSFTIPQFLPAEPYKQLIYAIAMVETGCDPLACNPLEEALGMLQIRPVRLNDYNKRTVNAYSRKDLFDSRISERIFLYYADLYGPYNLEKIARRWNGSGQMTDYYWKRISQYL